MKHRTSAPSVTGRLLCGLALLSLWSVVSAACGRQTDVAQPAEPGPQPPESVILVTLDAVRAGHLGCYGDADASTPVIDRLAASGLLFERVWSPVPITLPAHATILTGLPPAAHGVRLNNHYRLPPSTESIAEILQARGFATGAFVSAEWLDHRFGLAQGFDHFGDDLTDGYVSLSGLEIRSRSAAHTVDDAIAWLDTVAGHRFFLWVHLYDAYQPERTKHDRTELQVRPYDLEISRMDRELGRLIAHLESSGLRDRAAIVVTADHGEGLGEHGEERHGMLLYDSTLRVPLIVHHPGSVPTGRRSEVVGGLVDVAPTVLDLLDLPPSDRMAGRSLLSEPVTPRILLIETMLPAFEYGWAPLQGIVTGDYKYIEAPIPEVYDLRSDPEETVNLWDRDPDTRRMAGLRGLALARLEPLIAWSDGTQLNRRALRSAPSVAAEPERPQRPIGPEQGLDFVRRLKEATSLYAAGRLAEASVLLEELVLEDPHSYQPLWMLGHLERVGGRTARAEDLFTRAVELHPDRGPAHVGLGLIEISRGERLRAENHFRAATRDPTEETGPILLAATLLHVNHLMAAPAYRRGDSAGAANAYRPSAAVPVLEQAAADFPYSERIHLFLAEIYWRQGRTEEARQAIERALSLRPDDSPARELWAKIEAGTPPESSVPNQPRLVIRLYQDSMGRSHLEVVEEEPGGLDR